MIVRNSLGKFWQILTKAHPHFHIQGIALGILFFGIACNLDVKRRSHEKTPLKYSSPSIGRPAVVLF
jgi:hypothetical protein